MVIDDWVITGLASDVSHYVSNELQSLKNIHFVDPQNL